MIKLLITDLDDTLYSWIGFFIPAFYDMVDELAAITGLDQDTILREYKVVHQKKGSVEYPYAALLLPSVLDTFPDYTREQLQEVLDPAFHRFNSARKRELRLFPHVKETLEQLCKNNIRIVAYTESAEENGYYRLKKLGIHSFFADICVSDSEFSKASGCAMPPKTKTAHGKKPNSGLLLQILREEHVEPYEAIYIGDSLTKDIYMAKKAGIASIHCKYPPRPDADELYQKLVAISSWTELDFKRELELKEECARENIHPDYVIHSFDEVIDIIESINKERHDGT